MIQRLHAWAHASRKRLLMALLGLMTGVEFLENLMFVFAASHIMGGVDASPREFAQVQAAYAVGSMLMIVKQQWLAQRYGYRRYLAAALGVFMLGTLAASASDTLAGLTAARFVQGLGGGALFTSSRILVNLLFPATERPRALKYFMVSIFGASALAPTLAAHLVEAGDWRMVFYGVLPLAGLAMLGAWLLLPDAEPADQERAWEIAPLLWFAAAIIAVQLVIADLRYDVFAHPARLLALGLFGGGLLAGFLWHQWHHPTPLLRLRPLHEPTYLTGLGLYFLYYVLANFSNYLFPVFAEQALGTPLQTAGYLNSFSATISFLGILAYLRVARRIPYKKPLMAAGALALLAAALWFAQLSPQSTTHQLAAGLVAKGLFGVLLVIPVAGLTFRSLGDDNFPHGYQSKNLMRQLAQSSSAAFAAVLLQNRAWAVEYKLAGDLQPGRPGVQDWLAQAQQHFAAAGMNAQDAMTSALAQLAAMTSKQALVIACQDIYRLLAALCAITLVLVLLQRRLQ